jgi:hypothetical protein
MTAVVSNYRVKQLPESSLCRATNRIRTADRLGVLKSEYFDVLLRIGDHGYRACKVQFRRQAGALATYVHFLPSFGPNFGRLRKVELRGPAQGPETIKFTDGSTTTTRLVKFNHPGDGRAHFSGGFGIRRLFTQSRPLRDVNAQLFTLNFWNASGFALAAPPKKNSEVVRFDSVYPGAELDQIAGRLIAWCYHRSRLPYLGEFNPAASPNEAVTWTLDNGDVSRTVILAPPLQPDHDDLVVLISYFPMDISTGPGYPVMSFVGGSDGSPDQSRPNRYLNFLALKYASQDEDFEDMVRIGGSLDYVPDTPDKAADTA